MTANVPLLPQLKMGFHAESAYRAQTGPEYSLLPLRFIVLDNDRYVATNFAGQHTVLKRHQLHALITHRLSNGDAVYDKLKSCHFLFDGDSNVAIDLLACQYRTKQSLLSELTSLFMFVVTLRCEHSCPYCQVSRRSQDTSAFDMTQEYAAKAIEFVFSSPSRTLKVEFQGGEPLLNFALIRWIVEQVETRNADEQRDIRFVIATNLALVTEDILSFCHAHAIQISTSLDGPDTLHNANRPRPGHDSYERTIDGIGLVRRYLGKDSVSALMTTTRASLSQPEAIIDEYVRQGFSSIFLRSISPFGFAVKTGAIDSYSTEEWLSFYEKALRHILALNDQGIRFREEYASLILRKILTSFPTAYVDLQSPAGIGISCLAFNYDGGIYASDEARMLAEMQDFSFRLGHLSPDRFEDVMVSDQLLSILDATMTESVPMCSECGFQPYCGSDPVYHWATQGDVIGTKSTSGFCQKNMQIMRLLIRLLEDDPRAAEILRSWIS
jgi:uncharacterized protein